MEASEQRVVRRVAVLGSSAGIMVRPNKGLPYPRLLERALNEQPGPELWLVENLGELAGMADDLPPLVRRAVTLQPDVVVLQYGHVEALVRPHSRRLWTRTYMRRPDVSPWEAHLRRRVLGPYSELRRRLGLRRQLMPLRRFERVLDQTLAYLREDTLAMLVLVEALPVTPRLEKYGPGSTVQIARYNEALARIAARHGAELVTIEALCLRDPVLADMRRLTPDGSHFSPQGHVALAAELCARIAAR